MNSKVVATALCIANLVVVGTALAQNLPPPTRVVYKCEREGKIVYSEEPCLGAKQIDVEPTRGLNKSSGQARTGADVRRERFREQMGEAIKPLTGESAESFAVRVRRQSLSPAQRAECDALDPLITPESANTGVANDQRLFEARKRFRELRC